MVDYNNKHHVDEATRPVSVIALAVCNSYVSSPNCDELARERNTSSFRDASAAAIQLQRFEWCSYSVVDGEHLPTHHFQGISVLTVAHFPVPGIKCCSTSALDELK